MTTITHPHIATRITSYLERNPYATTADVHRDIHRKHNRITTTLDDLHHADLIEQHPNHGWTLTNLGHAYLHPTPDTPVTPTPPTIAAVAALVDGWESYEWQIPCPTIVDKAFANGYEAATSDRARELRGALLDQQSADKDLGGTCGAPHTELWQPSLEVAKAVVDELEARMRDRLRAWGLQCEDDSSSDQETQP